MERLKLLIDAGCDLFEPWTHRLQNGSMYTWLIEKRDDPCNYVYSLFEVIDHQLNYYARQNRYTKPCQLLAARR